MASPATSNQKESRSEKPRNDTEIVMGIQGDDKSITALKSALQKKQKEDVNGLAATCVIEMVKSQKAKKVSISCTERELKALIALADKDRICKNLKIKNVEEVLRMIVVTMAKDESTNPKRKHPSSKGNGASSKDNQGAGNDSASLAPDKISSSNPPSAKSTSPDGHHESSKEKSAPGDEEVRQLKETIEQQKNLLDKRNQELNEKELGIEELQTEIKTAHAKCERQKTEIDEVMGLMNTRIKEYETEIKGKSSENEKLDTKLKQVQDQANDYKTQLKDISNHKRNVEQQCATFETELRANTKQLRDISAERDEIRDRFVKLAGSKLTDQNADVADLRDPNRAVKLAEKFAQLYNKKWTDTSMKLKSKKLSKKETITFLLKILQECLEVCNSLKNTQMDILKNVLLHPAQDVSQQPKHVAGSKDKPIFTEEDEIVTLALRRQVAVKKSIIEDIKQIVCSKIKALEWRGYEKEKKNLDLCMPYIETCTEICWLMVIHNPPLFIKLDTNSGDILDTNLYTEYASQGNTIDFVVWPPLFNEKGGGLLHKGVAQPFSEERV